MKTSYRSPTINCMMALMPKMENMVLRVCRALTIMSFPYRKNEQWDVALTWKAFGNVVCSWVVIVCDCLFLQLPSKILILLPCFECNALDLDSLSDVHLRKNTAGLKSGLEHDLVPRNIEDNDDSLDYWKVQEDSWWLLSHRRACSMQPK